MQQLQKKLTPVFRRLQNYDTSLGIRIRENEIVMVKTRKMWKGFQVLKTVTVPYSKEMPLAAIISDTIKENRLQSTYTMVNTPRRGMLLKKVSVPLMDAGEIPVFLHQNTELFLAPGLELQQVQFNFKIMYADEDKLHLLVLIYRTNMIEEYLTALGVSEPFQILYPGFHLLNLVASKYSEFSGLLVEVDDKELAALMYSRGNLINYQVIDLLESSNLNDSVFPLQAFRASMPESGEETESLQYLIGGSKPQVDDVEQYLHQYGMAALNEEYGLDDPLYYGAFSLSINPFLNRNDDFDLNPEALKFASTQRYFKQLTLKSIMLFGAIILVFAVFIYTLQGLLAWQYNRYELKLAAISPLISTRDSLAAAQVSLNNTRESYFYLTQQKTHFAYYLYKIAGVLPEKTWCTKIQINKEKDNGTVVRLQGLSLTEAGVAQFLKELENISFAQNIVLDEMAVYTGKDIYRKWKLNYNQLIEFRVHFNVTG